jgi:hypothetical protein
MLRLDENKTIYLLGFLATVLSWQASKVTEDITSARSVAYWTEDYDNQTYLIKIENISNDKSVANVRFRIRCNADARSTENPKCIRISSIAFKSFPPTWFVGAPEIDEVGESEDAQEFVGRFDVTATIAAGGTIGILVAKPQSDAPASTRPGGAWSGRKSPLPFELFYIPDEAGKLNILVLDGRSPRGLMVRYFFEAVMSLLVLTLALIFVLLVSLLVTHRGRVEKDAQAAS